MGSVVQLSSEESGVLPPEDLWWVVVPGTFMATRIQKKQRLDANTTEKKAGTLKNYWFSVFWHAGSLQLEQTVFIQ